LVNKTVLSCLLKDGKEVNAVMLVIRLFHARATLTNEELNDANNKMFRVCYTCECVHAVMV